MVCKFSLPVNFSEVVVSVFKYFNQQELFIQ